MDRIMNAPYCDVCFHIQFFANWKVEKKIRKGTRPIFGGKQIENFGD
jgi:hypothetical protein